MDWHTAKAHAESLGGYLTTITSQSENDFLWINLGSVINNFIWLGATDEVEEGVWKWVTGETFWLGGVDGQNVNGSYSNWGSNEPDDLGSGQDYLAFFASSYGHNGGWDDFGPPIDYHEKPFIVEWDSFPTDPLNTDDDEDGFTENQGDCDDTNPEISPDAIEVCNGIDDNCSGLLDDVPDNDNDGFTICEGDCNDNDQNVNPSVSEIAYNCVDNDCNPTTPYDDLDNDGFAVGVDCNDNDPDVNLNETEIPYNGKDDDCNPTTKDDDLDNDNFLQVTDCDDNDPTVNLGATEIPYNGKDDDCKATTPDDDLDGDGHDNSTDCNDNDSTINPDAQEIKHDGIDQNCNGYDLTIDILKANYNTNNDGLRVEATSSLGSSASLNLEGYGAMEYNALKLKWQINVKNAGGDPGTVTVCGVEGCESANTNQK
jgi:hypothetical protein